MKPLRVLSLWQPWASLMAVGAKRYETRSWAPPFYRGLVAIHASKTTECDYLRDTPAAETALAGIGRMPHGVVLAVARLVDCHATAKLGPQLLAEGKADEHEFGDYSPGRFAWEMTELLVLGEKVPWRATQGLFVAPPELRAAIARQLPQLGLMESEVTA